MHAYWKFMARISPIFRRRRIEKFVKLFAPTSQTRILDLGGLPRFWQGVSLNGKITIVNLDPLDDYEASFLTDTQQFAIADGTHLPYEDGEFDIVFSNSVIEHLGSLEQQRAFARECRRVGKSYWVQTPAKEFPVEPHYCTVGLHWCPKRWQYRLLRYCSLWGLMRRPDAAMIKEAITELRLLRRREFKNLFPDGQIWTERVLGLPKGYTAFRLSA